MATITLKIRRQDIARGRQGNWRSCAVAKAINNVLDDDHAVEINGTDKAVVFERRPGPALLRHVYPVESRSVWEPVSEFEIPKLLRKFIRDFDRGTKIKVMRFNVEIPERFLDQAASNA